MTVYIPEFETQTDQRAPLPWTNCTFAAGAMLIGHWTWGGTKTDDIRLRNASGIPVNLGANFATLRRAIFAVYPDLDLQFSEPDLSGNNDITWRQLRDHLANGGAACVAGSYANLRPYKSVDGKSMTRWQPMGEFGHAMLAVDYRPDDETVLLMDPLGRGDYAGDRVHIAALWAFIYKRGNDPEARIACAYRFKGARPAAPTPPTPTGWAGKTTAFGTRYPVYVRTDAEALAWYKRNIRWLREAGKIIGY